MLRPILIAIALAACARAEALPTDDGGQAAPPTEPGASPTLTQAGLQRDLRSAFVDQTTVLRSALVEAADVDRPSDVAALLRNYYGDAVAPLEGQLHDEVLDARDIGVAVKAKDALAVQAAANRAREHAVAIGETLAKASPGFASIGLLLSKQAVELGDEGRARLALDFEADVAAHDGLTTDARAMAQIASTAIAADFPGKVSPTSLPSDRIEDAFATVFDDRAAWMRMLAIDGDVTATMNRVMRNQVETGNALAIYYGAEAGSHATFLLAAHAVHVYDAIKSPDDTDVRQRAYASGAEVADYLVSLNPFLASADLGGTLRADVDSIVRQAAHPADLGEYDRDRQLWVEQSAIFGNAIAMQLGDRVP